MPAELGKNDGTAFTAGSQGSSNLNSGSVTCDTDAPYALIIKATGLGGTVEITHNGKVAIFLPGIKKLGAADVNNSSPTYAGTGAHV